MATCRYCRQPAGLLRWWHGACADRHAGAKKNILDSIRTALNTDEPGEAIAGRISKAAKDGFVSGGTYHQTVMGGVAAAVESALDDHAISPEEETRISGLCRALAITGDNMESAGLNIRMAKGVILHNILEGKFPAERINFSFSGSLPFKFQKSEELIWVFEDVGYMERRTRRIYKGKTAGVSVRVARGVYLRTGGFRGEPVDHEETVELGEGLMAITTKHVYFSGDQANFRVHLDKIVTVQHHANAVEIVKDGVRAKPQIFILDDPWFACNLIQNVSLIE